MAHQARYLILGSLLAGALAPALAAAPRLGPSWATQPVGEWKPNISVLSKLENEAEPTLNDELLDSKSVPRLRQEYEGMTRDYEERKNAGLVDPTGQGQQISKMNDFTKVITGEIRRTQVKRMGDSLKSAAGRDENVSKPLKTVVGIAAISTGAPVDAKLSEKTKLRASANVPYQVGYAQLFSPIGTSTVTFAGDPEAGNRMTLPPPDWIARDEHYVLSFSRQLPLWELGSGLSYGGTSNTVSATVSKELRRNLVASMSTIHPVDVDTSRIKAPEETLRLTYELHF